MTKKIIFMGTPLFSVPILKSLHHWGDTKKRTVNKVIEKSYANL